MRMLERLGDWVRWQYYGRRPCVGDLPHLNVDENLKKGISQMAHAHNNAATRLEATGIELRRQAEETGKELRRRATALEALISGIDQKRE
jgi:hypothetical protein